MSFGAILQWRPTGAHAAHVVALPRGLARYRLVLHQYGYFRLLDPREADISHLHRTASVHRIYSLGE